MFLVTPCLPHFRCSIFIYIVAYETLSKAECLQMLKNHGIDGLELCRMGNINPLPEFLCKLTNVNFRKNCLLPLNKKKKKISGVFI